MLTMGRLRTTQPSALILEIVKIVNNECKHNKLNWTNKKVGMGVCDVADQTWGRLRNYALTTDLQNQQLSNQNYEMCCDNGRLVDVAKLTWTHQRKPTNTFCDQVFPTDKPKYNYFNYEISHNNGLTWNVDAAIIIHNYLLNTNQFLLHHTNHSSQW